MTKKRKEEKKTKRCERRRETSFTGSEVMTLKTDSDGSGSSAP
jgi:hypothetical protein